MKNKRINSLISLLLVLVMAISMLASCSNNAEIIEYAEDLPVVAEPKVSNFLKFETEEDNALTSVADLTDELGMLKQEMINCAIFYKYEKDRLNNLTETYTVYSLKDQKVIKSITNTYKDEFGGLDDFGNQMHPEKEITEVRLLPLYNTVTHYFAVYYTAYTRLSDEAIEKSKDKNNGTCYSYIEEDYVEYYDAAGNLITTSYVTDAPRRIDDNDYYSLISLGKTVALFNEDGVAIETYDGDTASQIVLYDHMNERYNYLLSVPTGAQDDSADMNGGLMKIFDKQGNLLHTYAYGDNHFYHQALVLENGDVIIQHANLTDGNDYDVLEDDMKYTFDTFLFNVRTGEVRELKDFNYLLYEVEYKSYFEKNAYMNGMTATDNVHNVFSAVSFDDPDNEITLFMDNLGNVNFVFDGKLCYEIYANRSLWVLDDKHVLIQLESGVSSYAIMSTNGNIIAYVPEEAKILNNYIYSGDTVYDFDMRSVYTEVNSWQEEYTSVSYCGAVGNTLVYDFQKEDDNKNVTTGVIVYDARYNDVKVYTDYSIYNISSSSIVAHESDLLVLQKRNNDGSKTFSFINGNGNTVFSIKAIAIIRYTRTTGDKIYTFRTINDDYMTVKIGANNTQGGYEG